MSWQALEAVQDHSEQEDHTALCIMYALARSADARGVVGSGGRYTAPNIDTIAGRAHCHRNTVLNWLPRLEESGELKVERLGKGRGAWNRYTILLPMPEEPEEEELPDPVEQLSLMVQELAVMVQATHEMMKVMVQETVQNGTSQDVPDTKDTITTNTPHTPHSANGHGGDRDVDAEYRETVVAYEQEIGPITQHVAKKITEALVDFRGGDLVEAIHIAAESNVRKWRYINAVLDRWRKDGQGLRPAVRETKTVRLLDGDGRPVKEVVV